MLCVEENKSKSGQGPSAGSVRNAWLARSYEDTLIKKEKLSFPGLCTRSSSSTSFFLDWLSGECRRWCHESKTRRTSISQRSLRFNALVASSLFQLIHQRRHLRLRM